VQDVEHDRQVLTGRLEAQEILVASLRTQRDELMAALTKIRSTLNHAIKGLDEKFPSNDGSE